MFGLFKNAPKNRQFDYRPLFYDKQKEELNERIEMYAEKPVADASTSNSPEAIKARISHGFKINRRTPMIAPAKTGQQSWILFFIILTILIGVTFFLLRLLTNT